jgi:hypothetical protein
MKLISRLRRGREALVLGCGPAGLFAAHGLSQNGWDVTIVSKKRRSEMFGAQYLHHSIPGLSSPSESGRLVTYRLWGTVEGYREKVYGRRSGITVSPETLEQSHLAWDIRSAYHRAWSLYSESIIPQADINSVVLHNLMALQTFDVVISSLPATALCEDKRHTFDSQEVWAAGDAPERGLFCPITTAGPFEIICSGDRNTGWYRSANVFGYRTAEWGGEKRPPLDNLARVIKPLATDCDCWPGVIRVGRYGEWKKGVLAHEAYTKAVQL